MNIKEAIEHCWDRKDYPEVFRDDAGLDISIPGFITRGSWIRNNSPRTVTLDVTTYRGVSWNAVHYYGNIIIDGVSFSPEDSPNTYTMCTETYEAEEKNPLAAGFYRIELVRPVTSEEIDPVDNNGSPTREIYNDKDELMWHNAELVNRGEIITQGIRSISENLSLIMEGEPESFRGGDIAFSTARRVMEMLGWKCSYAGKATLGQDTYYCIICTKPDKDFKYKIFGNAYEGSISISKEKL